MNKLVKTLLFSVAMFSLNAIAKPAVELYKSPSCGCCGEWAAIMEQQGYQVNVHLQNDWSPIKASFAMPPQLASCHTAVIDGYMIEGHVPVADIERLLSERPKDVSGIAAPGMPRFSPGMARKGEAYRDFNVVAFDKQGKISLYQGY
ncbi:DUF411 domain-containing protein [Agarivorans gilvus]|jgi:hypothetical protein|uniref:Copper amine oxidase n=2 Tax=Agarivorans TaxID=261825 RepID=A0ABQ1I6T8_9ALTE|nr:DUF411 domain-containing protein [Agarivorans gilvus]GGB18815.1 copper amine oxidase [Agarivorans gilvus]